MKGNIYFSVDGEQCQSLPYLMIISPKKVSGSIPPSAMDRGSFFTSRPGATNTIGESRQPSKTPYRWWSSRVRFRFNRKRRLSGSGYTDHIKRNKQFGVFSLRLAKALQPGFVVTMEPGIYFISQLMDRWRDERKNLLSTMKNSDHTKGLAVLKSRTTYWLQKMDVVYLESLYRKPLMR